MLSSQNIKHKREGLLLFSILCLCITVNRSLSDCLALQSNKTKRHEDILLVHFWCTHCARLNRLQRGRPSTFLQAGQRPFSSVLIRCQQKRQIWYPQVQGKKLTSSISSGSIHSGHSMESSFRSGFRDILQFHTTGLGSFHRAGTGGAADTGTEINGSLTTS